MPQLEATGTAGAIWRALDEVLDPCSRFNGSRLSFVALGMVDDVSVSEDGEAHIVLLLDDPTCLYMVEIHKEVTDAALSVPGVSSATISLRSDMLWGSERMTPEARAKLDRPQPARLLAVGTLQGPANEEAACPPAA